MGEATPLLSRSTRCRSAYTLEALVRTKSIEQCIRDTQEDDGLDVGMVDASCAPHVREDLSSEITGEESGSGSGSESESGGAKRDVKHGSGKPALKRRLGLLDVILYGLGATVGAGIYSLVGIAAKSAGPGIAVSFILGGIAGLLTAFVYAEFAARVPVAGSAYTYSYATFGELTAWMIGWSLTLEYAISAAVVARSFGDYFVAMLEQFSVSVPAWVDALEVLNMSCSPLAALVILVCTAILTSGVKNSAIFNLVITFLNILVLVFVVIAGSTKVDPANWTVVNDSFFPYGANAVVSAAGQLFFSYIGFDAVTCIAEEVKRPIYLPIGIMSTLGISCVIYVAVSIVVTGMAPFTELGDTTVISTAFQLVGMDWAAKIVSFGALFGTSAAVFVVLLGQSRIFFRIARDGLLTNMFGYLSPVTGAPVWGIICTGVVTAIVAFLSSLDTLSKTISIGTLVAFSFVNAGVLLTRYHYQPKRWLPLVLIAWFTALFYGGCLFLHFNCVACAIPLMIGSLPPIPLMWLFVPKITPQASFLCPLMPLTPFLGLGVNLFLISGLDATAWLRLILWMVVGLAIYFAYGIRYSRQRKDRVIPSLRGFFCCD
ncbi:amino acid permease [Pelomyxa schiedti]|nr:amino acid permease [Pelomyxa schiedti]